VSQDVRGWAGLLANDKAKVSPQSVFMEYGILYMEYFEFKDIQNVVFNLKYSFPVCQKEIRL